MNLEFEYCKSNWNYIKIPLSSRIFIYWLAGLWEVGKVFDVLIAVSFAEL